MSDQSPPSGATETTPSLSSPNNRNSPNAARLLKSPPIPAHKSPKSSSDEEDNDEEEEEEEEEEDDEDDGEEHAEEEDDDDEEEETEKGRNGSSSPSKLSPFGLNYIRTRSIPSPLRFSSSKIDRDDGESSIRVKIDQTSPLLPSPDQGSRKVHWNQSDSQKHQSPRIPGTFEGNYSAYAKEIQSPRFQAILRVTSGRKKGTAPEIKSFSHELNSKGVRPFPLWKPRALVHVEEIMVAIRAKFDKLKEEVDSDLAAFAGDLVAIIQTPGVAAKMKEGMEDLLVVARRCVKMESDEFWVKCEAIVQELDDKRQELPPGMIKQAHTRILFILTRCSRLVQFQKESGYEEDRILGLHQLSDLGVYPELLLEALQQQHRDGSGRLGEKNSKKLGTKGRGSGGMKSKRGGSPYGSYRMSSWKKLPSPAARSRKETPEAVISEMKPATGDKDGSPITPETLSQQQQQEEQQGQKVAGWGFWGSAGDQTDHHHHHLKKSNKQAAAAAAVAAAVAAEEHLMICRICEVEIPTAHAEEHSRICTIADRCDLKGLTVNERLERVAETLEKIAESWTSAKGTPKGGDTTPPEERVDLMRVSALSELEELRCADDMLETSSGESLTPRSPLQTPRTSHVEVLMNGRKTLTELESHDQIIKLMEVARSVANVNTCDYTALQYIVERLEYLKYVIQDRKVDGLVIETFGRCIEKMIQEKYVHLSAQIDDEKVDTSCMADEESSLEEENVRSLRTSPINTCPKDRTTIEDFEIIKPISRGAFGRVFLAKKRSTGDLFAIKVLKKADMIRKNAVESILAERNILISLRNPFVVRFYYSFTCRENLYLVMEYLNGGDLYSLLRNLGCLDDDMARIYIAEVVLALEYLHSLNVIHRDLKPDNLLIGQDGHVKLTDFGLSKVGLINSTDDLSASSVSCAGFLGDKESKTPRSSKREARQKQSVVGTPDYLAPEILLGMGHGVTADWWSVGVILFELLVGIPPFNADHPQKIFDNIINRDIPWPKTPEEMSFEAYDLIDKLLTENPVQRLGATGAGEVKKHPFFKNINWDTLARQKAMFIPTIDEAHDTSYFMSRFIWNPEDEHVTGGSDFDDMTESCSSASYTYSNVQSEDGDECGSMTEFTSSALAVQYSFSNFSFKNLSQLASINYDLVVKSHMESSGVSKHMDNSKLH